MTNRAKVMVVAGTRPEVIKIAPVLAAFSSDQEIDAQLVLTGQHREICDQVLTSFGLTADCNLDLMRAGQDLPTLTARAIKALSPIIEESKPDALLVQGDTTTAFVAALAAFYAGVPVVHLEAGLRTGDISSPFPEEANRKLISVISQLHLAPGASARANLLAEGVDPRQIVVTGNTVVDALHLFLHGVTPATDLPANARIVCVTTHRRENWGDRQVGVAKALARSAHAYPETTFVVLMHPNPVVRASLVPSIGHLSNVRLMEPVEYGAMVRLLARSWCVVTDSGGIQEEACALGVPVLVLRDKTERPEGVEAGVARLIGCDSEMVEHALDRMLRNADQRNAMARASTVFGDGHAAQRAHAAMRQMLGLSEHRLPDYIPINSQETPTQRKREKVA